MIPLVNIKKNLQENFNKKLENVRELCTLVYVSSHNSNEWKSIGCFNQKPITHTTKLPALLENAIVIYNIKPAERYKARFCLKNDLTVCSSSVEIYG